MIQQPYKIDRAASCRVYKPQPHAASLLIRVSRAGAICGSTCSVVWSLLFIFIDHIPNNVLSYVTLHSIAFSDAAEVFVFIAGYAAATVYGKAFERQGCLAASGRIYRRVWQLYVAHILTFVVLAAGLCYAALRLQNQTYIEDFGID